MDNINIQLELFDKVDVDVSSYISDRAKELRGKMRGCQSQMEYLGYIHCLYLKKFDMYRKEYDELLGVKNDKSV